MDSEFLLRTGNCESAQTSEYGVASQMLREFLLIRRQSGTDEVMSAVEAELTHFDHRLVCGPPFCPHPIGGDHHPGPIVTQPAVHKYFLVWIIPHQFQEPCEGFVLRERTVPWNRNILHSV